MPDQSRRLQNALILGGAVVMMLGGIVSKRYLIAVIGLVIAAIAMRNRRSV